MSRLLTIAKREYMENVRTKTFLIGLILTPLWLAIVFFVPALVEDSEKVAPVVLVDETGLLGDAVAAALESQATSLTFEVERRDAAGLWDGETGDRPIDALRRLAGAGETFVIVLTQPVLEKRAPKEDEHAPMLAGASGLGAAQTLPVLEAIVNEIVNAHLVEARSIDPEVAALLQRPALHGERVDEHGERAGAGNIMKPLIFMMFLFMGIMGISQMLINSTLEEKGNRIYEVLLSSVSPLQLMAGKILGVCGVGFTLMTLWAGGAFLAASAGGFSELVTAGQLGWLISFYVLGFLFIASLMVAVGSACNTIKEAQNLMAPISIMLAMPLILSMLVLNDPNGTLARILSFIPPFTPFIMMARVSSVPAPPVWEVWTSLLCLLVATGIAFHFAARVFRVGILLYGQPPSLKQIVKWMFRPDA